jgi:hypothetical protein
MSSVKEFKADKAVNEHSKLLRSSVEEFKAIEEFSEGIQNS